MKGTIDSGRGESRSWGNGADRRDYLEQVMSNRGIPCPKCGHMASRVLDSRIREGKRFSWRRRRQCSKCSERYTTYEVRADDLRTIEKLQEAMAVMQQLTQVVSGGQEKP